MLNLEDLHANNRTVHENENNWGESEYLTREEEEEEGEGKGRMRMRVWR